MLSLIANAGYATSVVDFTNELSSLIVGLISLTALSAAMIAVEAIRHRAAQRTATKTEATSAPAEYKQAA